VVALPHELNQLDQLALIRDYAQGLSRRTGWAVDIAVHAPGREGDQRNTHAHILCSTRKIERDENGKLHIGAKTRDWDVIATGKDLVMAERKEWEHQVNRYLEMAQSKARVDCRSCEAQGKIEQIPQIHLGVSASQMERKGIKTERGNRNRDAAEHSAVVINMAEVQQDLKEARLRRLEVLKWEGMQPWELYDKSKEIHPGSVREISMDDPEVWKAYQPVRDYDEFPRKQFRNTYYEYRSGEFGWLNKEALARQEDEVKRASSSVSYWRGEERRWRDSHPYKAGLFDMGVPNRKLKELKVGRIRAEKNEAEETEKLSQFKAEREKAETVLKGSCCKKL